MKLLDWISVLIGGSLGLAVMPWLLKALLFVAKFFSFYFKYADWVLK